MSNKLKGFSLIEVMILFTLMSAILAASMTMISKKTTPPMQKVSHGVYRCIGTPDGLIEEQYNGNHRVRRGLVDRCSFRVPEAAMYKVDMYSAGSGGNKSAYIRASQSDESEATLSPSEGFEGDRDKLLFELNDNFLRSLFDGTYMVRSVYTQDAGFGGGAIMKYNSVIDSSCVQPEHRDEYKAWAEQIDNLKNHHGRIAAKVRYWGETVNGYPAFELPEGFEDVGGIGGILIDLILNGTFSEQYPDVDFEKLKYNYYHQCMYGDSGTNDDCNLAAMVSVCQTKGLNALYAKQSEWSDKYDSVYEYITDNLTSAYPYSSVFSVNKMSPKDLRSAAVFLELGNISMLNNVGIYVCGDYNEQRNPHGYDGFGYKFYTNMTSGPSFAHLYTRPSVIRLYATQDIERHGGDYEGRLRERIDTIVMYNLTRLTNIIVKSLQTLDDKDIGLIKDRLESAGMLVAVKYGSGQWAEHGWDHSSNSIGQQTRNIVNRVNYYDDERGYYGRHRISRDCDDDEDDSLSFGVRFNDVVDDIIDKAVELTGDLRIPLDVSEHPYFKSAYVKNHVYNDEVKKQVRDYCRLEFADYYRKIGVNPESDKSVDNEIVYGGTRAISKYGGSEGQGRLSRLIYRINHQGTGKFEDYLTSINANTYPIACATGSVVERCVPADSDTFKKAEDRSINPAPVFNYPYPNNVNNSDQFYKESGSYKRYIKAQAGGSLRHDDNNNFSVQKTPYPYAAWRISGVSSPVKVSNTNASGGSKPNLYVKEYNANGAYVRPSIRSTPIHVGTINGYDYYSRYAIILGKNYAYTAGADNSTDGDDTEFINPASGNYAVKAIREKDAQTIAPVTNSLTQTSSPAWQDPKMLMQTRAWSKTYSLGRNGSRGNLRSTTESDLGTNCTFTVPTSGKVYRPNIDNLSGLQASLATSMKCTASDGTVVFDQSVDGGPYNQGYRSGADVNNNRFEWTRPREQAGSWEVSLVTQASSTNWRPTSIWSKLFRDFMIVDGGNYDIQSTYNVGKAGDGTKITDYCLAPRGETITKMQYLTQAYNSTARERVNDTSKEITNGEIYDDTFPQLSSELKIPSLIDDITETQIGEPDIKYTKGIYKGFNCYGDFNPDRTDITNYNWELRDDTPIVQNEVIKLEATPGGGGAVVITW